ncbi:MAG TPA: hypothetical protein VKB75_15915 [Jatrophihabitans sp.]|nr:hypothetical protein [Jatrophihabitans sp.]
MRPELPREPSDDRPWHSADEVGDFRQGSPLSQWALSRYLVGRAVGESVGYTLLFIALLVFGLAAACEWGLHSTFLTVVLCVLAVGVLLVRAVLRGILRRLTATDRSGPVEARLRELVSDTRGDVLRELRRVGLPSHTVTLPILAFRLVGKRREAALVRLREFQVERAVPKRRLDELHLLLVGR